MKAICEIVVGGTASTDFEPSCWCSPWKLRCWLGQITCIKPSVQKRHGMFAEHTWPTLLHLNMECSALMCFRFSAGTKSVSYVGTSLRVRWVTQVSAPAFKIGLELLTIPWSCARRVCWCPSTTSHWSEIKLFLCWATLQSISLLEFLWPRPISDAIPVPLPDAPRNLQLRELARSNIEVAREREREKHGETEEKGGDQFKRKLHTHATGRQ